MAESAFRGQSTWIGEGGELTLEQELWILLNSGKNIIESEPVTPERQVVNIVEKDGVIRFIHE